MRLALLTAIGLTLAIPAAAQDKPLTVQVLQTSAG